MPGKGATSVEVYGFTGWITTAVAYGMSFSIKEIAKLAQVMARFQLVLPCTLCSYVSVLGLSSGASIAWAWGHILS